jgi:PAS domain-containing protein
MASLPEFRENLFPDSIPTLRRLGEVPGQKNAENLRAEPTLAAGNPPLADQREQSRKSEEGFVQAFRSNPLAISITSQREGRYVDVNDAFLEMLGYQREQVIGLLRTCNSGRSTKTSTK